MKYNVLVSRPAQKDFRRLAPEHRSRIRDTLAELAEDPRSRAEKLVGEAAYRVRVGDYRVVFRVDDRASEVLVARIKHRREAYRR